MPVDQMYIFFIAGFTVFYAGFIIFIYSRLKSHKPVNVKCQQEYEKVSVIVAARNEEDNIEYLLKCLINQDYPKDHYEILIVDDYSEDRTGLITRDFIQNHPGIFISYLAMDLPAGKKNAIKYGAEKARFNNLLFTDADARMGRGWIKSMMHGLQGEKTRLVLGPVFVKDGRNLLQQIQYFEYLGLQSVTMGTALIGHATMGNGANLLYRRECIQGEASGTLTGAGFSSGDDVFLIHQVKKLYGGKSVAYAASPEAIVETNAMLSVRKLLWQHVRWTGKSKGYTDVFTIFTGFLTAAVNILIIILWILSVVNIRYLSLLLVVMALKITSEYLLIRKFSRLLQHPLNKKYYLISSVFYPVFVALVFLVSLPGKYYWKGRWVR